MNKAAEARAVAMNAADIQAFARAVAVSASAIESEFTSGDSPDALAILAGCALAESLAGQLEAGGLVLEGQLRKLAEVTPAPAA